MMTITRPWRELVDRCCDMRGLIVIIIIIACLWPISMATGPIIQDRGEVREYCQLEMFNASCAENQVIIVTSARYGRMRLGRCVVKAYGSLGCTSDVLEQMDKHCSGRQHCTLPVSSLHGRHPCPQDLTPFLEASYYCQDVLPGRPEACMASAATGDITAPTGYLSNYVTLQTDRGSLNCPWRLRAGAGQKINVTLVNFARAASQDSTDIAKSKPHVCYQFAVLEEGGNKRTLTECEGSKRIVHVHMTSSNTIDIALLTRKDTDFYFMLYYEVVGCSDPVLAASLWVQRTTKTAAVRCNATGDSWKLTCTAGNWHGHVGNCTVPASVDWQVGVFDKGSFPYSILIIVAIGVALGVFLGGILLVCASKYLRSRTSTRRNNCLYESGVYGAAPGHTGTLPHHDDDTLTPRLSLYQRERVKQEREQEKGEHEHHHHHRELKTPLGTYGQIPGYIPPGQTALHMYESPRFDRDDGR